MQRKVIELKLVSDETDETFDELKEKFIKKQINCHEVIPVPAPNDDEGLGLGLVPIFNRSEVGRYREILGRYEDKLVKAAQEGIPANSLDKLPLVRVDGMVYEPELLYESRLALEEHKEENKTDHSK